MSVRWWALVVAAVEAACGIGAAAYFVVLGLSAEGPDRTAFDRAFPFLLAALALGVLGTMAWRSLRRALSLPGDRGGFPNVGRQRGRQADTPRVPPPASEPPEPPEPATWSSSPTTCPRRSTTSPASSATR
ncbi:hypothetical protein GCM10023203_45060 [Actinomycetospora straminea]|uniref:Uncharacterized protein n=1 Tax=Actinomycetospora straminea TaxID=663607 RepID=A0ABP9EWD6_9PSEU